MKVSTSPPAIRSTIANADTCSLKRLAWAYGCSPKGSSEEGQLGQLLLDRVSAELVELGATWSAIASETLAENDQLRELVDQLDGNERA